MASMDSLREKKNERQTEDEASTQRLIRLYRANQCLWNPYSPGYHCMPLKQSAWNRITRILNNGLTTDQVKGQVLSLRNYYDMERQAIKRSQREGFHYVPCRSIFNDLQFLAKQELGEAEESKAIPSVRDDQVQCIIDDVMPVMNKDCAECRRSLHVDFHIPIGEKRSDSIISSSNNSFEEEEYDSSSLYDSDLETLPTVLPRATSGADRQYHRQDEEESSDSSYHHQSMQQYHGRGAREGGPQRYSRPAENYSHSCYYGHRSNHTTDVSVGDEESPCRVQDMSSPRQYGATGQKGALASNTRSPPKQHQQVQPPRPRSGMEASNCDSQGSKNTLCRPSTGEKACNVLLLKFNPRNSTRPLTNNKTICVNPPANYSESREDNRDYRDNNTSEQELQSAATPVYEDTKYYGNNNEALPADADWCCSYDRSAQYTQVYGQQIPQQNEPNEIFYYPEGTDPYEYIECYCPPDQLYSQEDAPVSNQGPTRRRPPPPFSEYHNTGPDAYRSRQNARPAAARTTEELRASSSKDITASAPNVRSWGSRSSGPDSDVAQQCAAVAAQIMKDYRLRKCVQPTYTDDDSDFCDEPVARRPQKNYRTAEMVSVECPARKRQQSSRNEVDSEASAKRQSGRASTPTKVPNSGDPQQKFLASLKSNYDNQGRRTPNQYRQDRQPGQDEYDDQECVADCPGISGTKDRRGDRYPPPCLSALSDNNNQEGGQEKFYRKPSPPSPASTPCEDYDTDAEQSPKRIPQRRSYPREEAQNRRAPPPYQRSEETTCNESCPSLNRNAMDVPPRQAPRRTSDRGQYSQPLTSQQKRRRSDNINDLQSNHKERRPPSSRQQQLRGPSNSDVDYIECPNRRAWSRAQNAEYAHPAGRKRRYMEAVEEPYMANRSLPNSPNNRQPISTQNSNQMYRGQGKQMGPYEVDECLCEDEPMVPKRTSPRRSTQNDRQPERTAPEIASPKRSSRNSPRNEPGSPEDHQEEPTAPKIASPKRSSRNSPRNEPGSPEDRQEEPTDPKIASPKRTSRNSRRDEPSSQEEPTAPETAPRWKRNSRDDRQQEQNPKQNFQRRSYQRDEPAQNPPQSRGFEEIPCNNESCPFQNLNVPETSSSMINSQEDRQPKSTPTSNKMYRSQEKPMDLVEVDECLCEDEPMVSKSTSARKIRQNVRQSEGTASGIASPKRTSRNSRRDEPSSQEEPTAPETAPRWKRNSRDDRQQEQNPKQNFQRRSYQRDEPAQNPPQSRGFEEIPCNNESCPFQNLNVPETSSSMINSQEDRQPKSTPTSNKMYRSQEKPMDLVEVDECLCEDEPMVSESTSARRIRQNGRQPEGTASGIASPKRSSRGNKPMIDEADECPCEVEFRVPEISAQRSWQNERPDGRMVPEIGSEKRISRQNEASVPEIASSKRTSRNSRQDEPRSPEDRQEEPTGPGIASPKRSSRGNKPMIDEADECLCEVEFRVPEISAQRSWQNERPDGRMVPEVGSEKRISRQNEASVPEIASSKRTSRNSRQDEPRSPEDRQEEPTGPGIASPKRSSRGNKPMIDEADECLCEVEFRVPEISAQRSWQNERPDGRMVPEVGSEKRISRQNEASVPEIASSKRASRNSRRDEPRSPEDRQEEPTGPEIASPKRTSLNSRGNKPIVDEADECPCEDEPMVPESTSAKRSRQNDRQQERIAPEIASSKRNSQNGRQPMPIDPFEIDECLCDDEPEFAASERDRIKNNRKDDERDTNADFKMENMKGVGNDVEEPEKNTRKGNSAAKNYVNEESSESDYEDAVDCERDPNECTKKANGTGRKDQENVGSDSEYCDFECGVECPSRKNNRNEPGNSKNTKNAIRGDNTGPESVSEKKNQMKSKVDVDDSSSIYDSEHKEDNQTDEKQAEDPTDEKQADELIKKETTDETESKSPKPVDKDLSMESAEDTQPKAQRGQNNTAQGVMPAQRKPRAQYVAKTSTLPAGVRCPRCQAIAARSNAFPKSRLRSCSNPEETAKKAIPARSSSGPCGRPYCQISGRRSMKRTDSDGGPSKPFDLRLASYYICQLQDDDEANQYLIIVPEAKFRRISAHRDCPRQESAKRGPCSPRQCSGFETLSWASTRPPHQSYPRKTEGLSVLGSYLVPPVAAETTMTIIKQHINKSIVDRKPPKELIQKNPKNSSSKKNDRSPPKMPRKPKTKPMTSMVHTQTSIQRPIHETNSILAENRTVLLTNNPSPKSNQEVIVLLPPVLGFRPSKNSLGLDDVQMQYVKVQHSEPHISPKPMKKPNLS
ncbi:serine/arginine repetitive matrix protein 2 isoform X1 [Drosophila obscura]|uniref:serine/arginine repetitive matrix protein 2 isoform X1 n=1 Tax=Drosophila obscura TaxID=7282 RepID=UPI001BB282BD|nr:serine/arginine repetitive matrix protein 2 isoform X1 [Drosophila obscura]